MGAAAEGESDVGRSGGEGWRVDERARMGAGVCDEETLKVARELGGMRRLWFRVWVVELWLWWGGEIVVHHISIAKSFRDTDLSPQPSSPQAQTVIPSTTRFTNRQPT